MLFNTKVHYIGKIAFWTYDQFPYTLYGEVVDAKASAYIDGELCVATKEYGKGEWFRPFDVMTNDVATKELINKIDLLHTMRFRSLNELAKIYDQGLFELMPRHPHNKQT